MSTIVFNENDAHAAAWLRNLFPEATVLETDIRELAPSDLADFTRVHLFGGIGGWEHALEIAGWPTAAPVWTGSCPCQPFSNAGQRRGEADERHLWPAMYRLVRDCRPAVVFGEQVASAAGRDWLARVRADLALLGYAVGAADLAAASVGAPHIRQRLYWVAYARGERHDGIEVRLPVGQARQDHAEAPGRSPARGVEHPTSDGRGERWPESDGRGAASRRGDSGLADAGGSGWRGRESLGRDALAGAGQAGAVGLEQPDSERCEAGKRRESAYAPQSHWADYELLPCLDGKARRIEPGLFPLVDGFSFRLADGRARVQTSRTKLLRGIGNAIVPEVAATFVKAFMESVS